MSFNVGVTALRTNQAALQVIGHNIANVNTPGFSRQNVILEQIPGQKLGNGFFGKGVEVAAVERSFSQFLTREANLTAAAAESANIRFQRLQTLEQLFPMGEAGMGRQLNGFLNSWADVVASPTNQTARGVVLSRADELARRLNQTATQLDELSTSTRLQITTSIDQVNRLSSSIATINQRIVDAFAGGRPPNDLLDQRDRLVADLNKLVEVRTLEADDRSITVFAANSVPIVLGNRSTNLVGSETVSPEGRFTIGFGREEAIISEDLLVGGSLKGLLTFFNDDVADVRNQLGRLALSTMELFNRQHQQGLDLNGEIGQPFFTPLSEQYFENAFSNIQGSRPSNLRWSIDGHLDAPSSFKASDYRIVFAAGGGGSIFRLSDNPPTEVGAFGQLENEVEFDGIRLTGLLSSSGAAEVLLRPFAAAASAANFRVNLTSPSQLAIASPIVIEAGQRNSGNLQVESLNRLPVAQYGAAESTVEIRFLENGQFGLDVIEAPFDTVNILDRNGAPIGTAGGPYDFVSGQEIVIQVGVQPPFRLVLRGSPAEGDTFEIRPADGFDMRQNTGNGQALLALRDLDALDGYTLSDGYIPVFAAVSTSIQIAKADSEFATRVATQAEAARANQAGVNLDEEAARLLQFQQAYQASARYLQSMQAIFDTLLSTFR